MDKKNIMWEFLNKIKSKKMMTKFIKNIFDYENFHDYNYIFRMINDDDKIVIDIYDNVSENRFNRYIFLFDSCDYDKKIIEDNNVFVNYISVLNTEDGNNKLLKLAYLFKIEEDKMVEYAEGFLDKSFVEILNKILK